MQEKNWELISDLGLWDKSLLTNSRQNFLQSSSFGQFNTKLGNKVWYFGISEKNKVTSFALVIKKTSKLGSFLYVPWGPIANDFSSLKELLGQLRELAEKEKAIFVRLEPRVGIENFEKLGLKTTNYFIQPECSLVLSLTQELSEIRKNLSETTRYNIGWVERQGVTVETTSAPSDFGIFEELLEGTARRQGFLLHKEKNYYREQFDIFSKNNQAKLFTARAPRKLGGEPLAAAIVIYFGNTVTYLHAASSSQLRNLRAPYLMQWKIIEDAKAFGALNYDFWGASKTDNPSESWAGVTVFKRGFGGERIFYPKPYDLIVSKKYNFIQLLERLRPLGKIFKR